jgi:ribosomal protein L21E
MGKGKSMRHRGKIQLSEYFKNISENETVTIVRELSIPSAFPKRLQGKTGTVVASRGTAKVVELKDGNKKKQLIIHPAHLKKHNGN